MKTLVGIEHDANGVASLNVPVGKRLRLVAITGTWGGATAGESVNVQFAQGNTVYSRAATSPGTADQTQFAFGIGQCPNPKNGADAVAYTCIGSLPDIWWLWQITVTVSAPVDTLSAVRSLYELEDV